MVGDLPDVAHVLNISKNKKTKLKTKRKRHAHAEEEGKPRGPRRRVRGEGGEPSSLIPVPGSGRGRRWRWRRRTGAAGRSSRRPSPDQLFSRSRLSGKGGQLPERGGRRARGEEGPGGDSGAGYIGGGVVGAESPRVDLTQQRHRVEATHAEVSPPRPVWLVAQLRSRR